MTDSSRGRTTGRRTQGGGATSVTEREPSCLDDAFDKLGARLYLEFRQGDAVSEREWTDLSEREREFYRSAAEGLILDWDLVTRAHARQIVPQ
jgi:hypothetical protein